MFQSFVTKHNHPFVSHIFGANITPLAGDFPVANTGSILLTEASLLLNCSVGATSANYCGFVIACQADPSYTMAHQVISCAFNFVLPQNLPVVSLCVFESATVPTKVTISDAGVTLYPIEVNSGNGYCSANAHVTVDLSPKVKGNNVYFGLFVAFNTVTASRLTGALSLRQACTDVPVFQPLK